MNTYKPISINPNQVSIDVVKDSNLKILIGNTKSESDSVYRILVPTKELEDQFNLKLEPAVLKAFEYNYLILEPNLLSGTHLFELVNSDSKHLGSVYVTASALRNYLMDSNCNSQLLGLIKSILLCKDRIISQNWNRIKVSRYHRLKRFSRTYNLRLPRPSKALNVQLAKVRSRCLKEMKNSENVIQKLADKCGEIKRQIALETKRNDKLNRDNHHLKGELERLKHQQPLVIKKRTVKLQARTNQLITQINQLTAKVNGFKRQKLNAGLRVKKLLMNTYENGYRSAFQNESRYLD